MKEIVAEVARLRAPVSTVFPNDAEDLLHSAFLAVLVASRKTAIRNTTAYFRQTLRYQQARMMRELIAQRSRICLENVSVGPVAMQNVARDERKRHLRAAMQSLPRNPRIVIEGVLRGESLEAVAERSGLTMRAAACAGTRGKQMLQNKLKGSI